MSSETDFKIRIDLFKTDFFKESMFKKNLA